MEKLNSDISALINNFLEDGNSKSDAAKVLQTLLDAWLETK